MTVPDLLTTSTNVDASFWIKAAQNAVRKYCRWHVAPPTTETIRLDGFGGTELKVPSLKILRLIEVLNDGEDVTDLVDYSPDSGILELRSGLWTVRRGRIQINWEHGYSADEVPEVAALMLELARRGGSANKNIVSQSTNGSSVSYAHVGGQPLSIPLLRSEKEILAPYRIEGRA